MPVCEVGQEPRATCPPALTCGIARTPDSSHLSCRSLLPHHGPEVVLVTDLMGLCPGARGGGWGRVWEGGAGYGRGDRERAAGSRRPRPFQNIYCPKAEPFPAKLSPKPTQLLRVPLPRARPGRWEGTTLTRASLGATLPILILGALTGCSPEERTGADTFPSLCATPTRDTAAAPRCPGLPLAIHCRAQPARGHTGGDAAQGPRM